MKDPLIVQEVKGFMSENRISAARLCKEAGLSSPSILTRVLAGTRQDMTSASADKLRQAMQRLSSQQVPAHPHPEREEAGA